jgi:hypothetical protein
MKTPACDPGDFCIAQRAETTLFIPEVAKSTSTPKRFQHVSPRFQPLLENDSVYRDVSQKPWPHGFGATLASVGPLSEGFERSVASPLQPRRLRAMGRTV